MQLGCIAAPARGETSRTNTTPRHTVTWHQRSIRAQQEPNTKEGDTSTKSARLADTTADLPCPTSRLLHSTPTATLSRQIKTAGRHTRGRVLRSHAARPHCLLCRETHCTHHFHVQQQRALWKPLAWPPHAQQQGRGPCWHRSALGAGPGTIQHACQHAPESAAVGGSFCWRHGAQLAVWLTGQMCAERQKQSLRGLCLQIHRHSSC